MGREIVDAHIHIFKRGCLPEKWFRIGAERWAGSKWPTPSTESIDIEGGLVDDDVEMLLPTLDAAGVSKAVCLTLDWGVHLGEPRFRFARFTSGTRSFSSGSPGASTPPPEWIRADRMRWRSRMMPSAGSASRL